MTQEVMPMGNAKKKQQVGPKAGQEGGGKGGDGGAADAPGRRDSAVMAGRRESTNMPKAGRGSIAEVGDSSAGKEKAGLGEVGGTAKSAGVGKQQHPTTGANR